MLQLERAVASALTAGMEETGLLSTSRKSTAGVSLPAFEWYFLETGSIGLLTEYRCYQLGIEILRELMHFGVGDTEDLTVVIII
jgi:hypothetical protein